MTEPACRLESLQSDDVNRLKQIATPWCDSWSPQDLYLSLRAADQGKILISDETPVGYGVYRMLPDVMEILNIAIFFDHRSKGYGRILVRLLEKIARQNNCEAIWLEVRSTNHVAKSLYRSCGFEVSGRRSNYYHTGDGPLADAVLMEKPLSY